MDRPSNGAVVAGTRAFAVALLAPVTARVGTRPRIASDAEQALALCHGPDGLAVIEYAGEASLPKIERLVREGGGLRVVVAVPAEHLGAEPALRSLGVEPVPWNGRPDDVVAVLGAPREPGRGVAVVGPERPPAPGPARPAPGGQVAPAARASVTPPGEWFADLAAGPGGGPGAAHPPAASAPPPPLPLPAPAQVLPTAWPAATPGAAEAAQALARALAGGLPRGAPLADVAEQAVAALSSLEREVLAGDPQPFDAAPVRAAAVMRLRVAAALAAAPAPGAPMDGAALQAILGEIDGLLGDVKRLLQDAPEGARRGLEAVRNALVREAIEFSEAAAGRAGAVAAPPARVEPPRRAPPPAPRMLRAEAPQRRPTGLLVLLALVAAGVLGYHGWRLHARRAPAPPPTFAGAPAGTLGVDRGRTRLLMTLPGHRVDPSELARFRRLEASKGNVLRPTSPGTWVIEPAQASQEVRP